MITRYLLIACLSILGIAQCEATGGDPTPPTSEYFTYYFKKVPRKAFIDIRGVPTVTTQAPTDGEVSAAFDGPADGLVSKMDQFISRARAAEFATLVTPATSDDSPQPPKVVPNLAFRQFTAVDHNLLNKLENLRDVAVAIQGGKVPADEVKSYVKWRMAYDSSASLDNFLQKASPELQPCWLYMEGAGSFLAGKAADALTKFDAVLNNPQGKPFSEMALFMKARCLQSMVEVDPDDQNQPPLKKGADKAIAAFKDYLTRYPQGRFVSDAWGWLGGLEPDDIQALTDFYNEASTADHPETLVSASNEMERIIGDLDYKKDDHGYEELATHPDLALYICYIAAGTSPTLEPPEYDDEDDSSPTPEQAAQNREYAQNKLKWHTHFLQGLATSVLAHKELYADKKGQAESVAILAHAASDRGDQASALALVQMADSSGAMGDDLTLVKALALQRSNNAAAAVTSFDDLIQHFPKSDLVPGATYRKAIALHDLGKNGEALKVLASLQGNKLATEDSFESQIAPESGVTDGEIFCTEDSISKFAPVESLLSPLSDTDPALSDFRKQLSDIVVARFLEKNDFKSASQYELDPTKKAEFDSRVSETDQVGSPTLPPADKAKLASGLGDYWASKRGQLSGPIALKEYPKIDKGDLSVAETLNFTQPDCKKIADSQDELVHATSWWEKVWHLDATSPEAPHALWKTLQAQRIFAEEAPDLGTPDDDAFAKDLYKNLTTHYPNSPEAQKYAVYWNLSNIPPVGDHDYSPIASIKDIAYPNTLVGVDDNQGGLTDTKAPMPDFGDTRLQPWFDKIFSTGGGGGVPDDAAAQNLRDETDEVNHTSGISEVVKKAFIAWLGQRSAPSDSDTPIPMPATIPKDQVAEFLDSDAVLTNAMTPADYLAKYPKSLRREEVLYHAIHLAIYAEKLDVPAAQKAFDDYLKEFPDSHLRRGVLYMQGMFEEKQQHWGAACEDYCQVLEQMKAPELHKDAAAHLAFIFEEMNQDELRKPILDDIQKQPRVRHWLRTYVQAGEMPYMKNYLLDHVKE